MSGGRGVVRGGRAFVATLFLGLILILPLAGCAGGTPTPKPTTITFACLDEDLSYYEGMARAFSTSHPHIRVRILPRRQAALQLIRPGESDVVVVSLPLEPRLEKGGLLSAEGQLLEKGDFYPCALSALTRDGQAWAVPIGADPVLMYYNRTLFDANEVPYPKSGWTWQEFHDTAEHLTNPWQGMYGYGAGLSREDSLAFVLENGGHLVDDWQNPTRFTFDDPQAVEALDWYQGLIYGAGGVAPSAYTVSVLFEQGVYGGIVEGKIAMWAGYYSARLDKTGASAVNWSAVTLPAQRQEVTLANVEAVAVSAQAAHPELCWQWADYLSRQVPLRMAPARRSVTQSQAFADEAGAETAAAVQRALEHAIVLPQAPASFYQKVNSLWATAVDSIIRGRADAVSALRDAQRLSGQ